MIVLHEKSGNETGVKSNNGNIGGEARYLVNETSVQPKIEAASSEQADEQVNNRRAPFSSIQSMITQEASHLGKEPPVTLTEQADGSPAGIKLNRRQKRKAKLQALENKAPIQLPKMSPIQAASSEQVDRIDPYPSLESVITLEASHLDNEPSDQLIDEEDALSSIKRSRRQKRKAKLQAAKQARQTEVDIH